MKNNMKKKMNWNINSQIKSENKILKDWVTRNYGPRCKEFVKGCVVCGAWVLYDKLCLYEINEKNARKLVSESKTDRAEAIEDMQKKEIDLFVVKVRKYPGMFKYLKTKMK